MIAGVMEISGNFKDYFSLKRANEELSRENAFLRAQLPANLVAADAVIGFGAIVGDSGMVLYNYQPAKVINNTINRRHNHITINKGSRHGVVQDMGVISARGIVGVVRHVSPRYSTVISVLNTQFRASAKLRETNYFGSLTWDGSSWMHMTLSEIPAHAPISAGDAVVTSGYSTIFPEGILVGTIESFYLNKGEGFYDIKVKLSVDFKNLTYVEVVEIPSALEQKELEKLTADD
jgi:rod shape-determining protein MreC